MEVPSILGDVTLIKEVGITRIIPSAAFTGHATNDCCHGTLVQG